METILTRYPIGLRLAGFLLFFLGTILFVSPVLTSVSSRMAPMNVSVSLVLAGVATWWLLPLLVPFFEAFVIFLRSPIFQRRWKKFRSLKRGYYAFILVISLFVLSFFSELLVNNRALLVKYQGNYYFPVLRFIRARDLGMTSYGLPNFRKLKEFYQNQAQERNKRFAAGAPTPQDLTYRNSWGDDWVWLPVYPYGPTESLLEELPGRPPHPPSWLTEKWRPYYHDQEWYQPVSASPTAELRPEWNGLPPEELHRVMALAGVLKLKPEARPPAWFQHPLGTDDRGRDVFARMVYGFRTSLSFALTVTLICYAIGISIGALLGFYGGTFDIVMQRFVEVWSAMPFLYTVMIIASIMEPNFWLLAFILCLFGWMNMTYYIRGEFLREKSRDYVAAARAIGCSDGAIIFRHILPNALTPVISFAPFAIVSFIGSLVSLDFLGFGLPPPTPSWGELMGQGLANLTKPWLILSPMGALFLTLLLVSFIGEAIREAFDPKEYSRLR